MTTSGGRGSRPMSRILPVVCLGKWRCLTKHEITFTIEKSFADRDQAVKAAPIILDAPLNMRIPLNMRKKFPHRRCGPPPKAKPQGSMPCPRNKTWKSTLPDSFLAHACRELSTEEMEACDTVRPESRSATRPIFVVVTKADPAPWSAATLSDQRVAREHPVGVHAAGCCSLGPFLACRGRRCRHSGRARMAAIS